MDSLHVEVVQKQLSTAPKSLIEGMVSNFVTGLMFVTPGTSVPPRHLQEHPELAEHVSAIIFCDLEYSENVSPSAVTLHYHVYKWRECVATEECLKVEVRELPARALHGLWESLVFDSPLKRDTAQLVLCALRLAALGVDPHLVGGGRVLLLHGPPGTGKTSLCRALAQKLAVRLDGTFERTRLLEINAHEMLSKWFGESGKLVARMLDKVHADVAAKPHVLTCVLLDEAESIAHARAASATGLEPSDAGRVVAALLTQLDRLRELPNALVLATSNVVGAVDAAFADRADIKRRVGPPSARAAYAILRSACGELAARGAVATSQLLFDMDVLECCQFQECTASANSLRLWAAARGAAAAALSARALRRAPLLALARAPGGAAPALEPFLDALVAALRDVEAEDAEFRDAAAR